MAQWHLDELLTALERKGWQRTSELPEDGYSNTGSWALSRVGQSAHLLLDFRGEHDIPELAISQSFVCYLRDSPASLYFGKRGVTGSAARKRWGQELSGFILAVEASCSNNKLQADHAASGGIALPLFSGRLAAEFSVSCE